MIDSYVKQVWARHNCQPCTRRVTASSSMLC
jgi:hypothetical protein